MDVTPSKKMFQAMQAFVDALCGEEPSVLMIGAGAAMVRQKRHYAFEILHKMVAVSMREGVARKVLELQAAKQGHIFDAEDLRAAQKAAHDAEEGGSLIKKIDPRAN